MSTRRKTSGESDREADSDRGNVWIVYCSVNGFGMGVFTIKGEQFIGISDGVNYDGTAQEQEDGSIVLDVSPA